MTNEDALDTVLVLAGRAVSADLLHDIDALSAAVEAAGWRRSATGGLWTLPDEPSWALISADHAPNLAVFVDDDDVQVVYALGQELARRLDRLDGASRQAGGSGWPAWERDDPRWAGWSGLEADWETWEGGPARLSLNVRPASRAGRALVRPNLHVQLERLDTPSEGLPPDPDRAERIRRSGSDAERWHLSGESV
ncbi:MAG: hypothetical protein Q7T71_11525 [Herbiconiux sp.]|nr:hypothetical protein [Herbiconiux sp.]